MWSPETSTSLEAPAQPEEEPGGLGAGSWTEPAWSRLLPREAVAGYSEEAALAQEDFPGATATAQSVHHLAEAGCVGGPRAGEPHHLEGALSKQRCKHVVTPRRPCFWATSPISA